MDGMDFRPKDQRGDFRLALPPVAEQVAFQVPFQQLEFIQVAGGHRLEKGALSNLDLLIRAEIVSSDKADPSMP